MPNPSGVHDTNTRSTPSRAIAAVLEHTGDGGVFASYPWLRASLEDHSLAMRLAADANHARHAVCLMHDAIEFLMYEALLLMDHDIYEDGQHTIGFNQALAECEELGISVPLLGTVRAIQKQRGDAKHHAQRPDEKEFKRITREFQIIVSRLVHERFAESLDNTVEKLGLLRYDQSLYATYRKYRMHRWPLAVRAALGAVLHKHRDLLQIKDEYTTVASDDSLQLLAALERDIAAAKYPAAKQELLDAIRGFPNAIREMLSKKDERTAAEYAGKLYQQMDEIFPSTFDIRSARQLTPKLLMPTGGRHGDHSWSKTALNDRPTTQEYLAKTQRLLRDHPGVVNFLGRPFLMEDDDSYWKWWELAVFDGEEWGTFHLNDHLDVALELGADDEESAQRRERQAQVVYAEFARLSESPEVLRTPKVKGAELV
jgi:hypothetical protein